MYRVALVQNASEMMRYGWADIRPSMQKFGYRIDAFTGEDIHLLFVGMDENLYDAIILSVNSCNDYRILSALCEKRDTTIKNFLENGNGIYRENRTVFFLNLTILAQKSEVAQMKTQVTET
jgi:hypothetical protein